MVLDRLKGSVWRIKGHGRSQHAGFDNAAIPIGPKEGKRVRRLDEVGSAAKHV
jgi:hypothetical protein